MFNVLLVEDNSSTQILLKSLLTRKFYCNVSCAMNGEEALKSLYRQKPDCILLDYMMPGMSGYDFLKELKAKKNYSDIPVLMVTAVNERSTAQKVISLGVADYILKPLNLNLTLEKIAKIMFQRNKDIVRNVDILKRRVNLLERQNDDLKKKSDKSSLKDIKIFLN